MHLFFPTTPKSQSHNPHTNTPTEECGFKATADEQSKTKCHQRTTTQLVFSTHEKTPPAPNYAEGVLIFLKLQTIPAG